MRHIYYFLANEEIRDLCDLVYIDKDKNIIDEYASRINLDKLKLALYYRYCTSGLSYDNFISHMQYGGYVVNKLTYSAFIEYRAFKEANKNNFKILLDMMKSEALNHIPLGSSLPTIWRFITTFGTYELQLIKELKNL